MSSAQLPDLSTEYSISKAQHEAFQRDGHIVLRGVATPDEVKAYRDLITGLVDDVARSKDTQGRISDYSAMFTQVTNVWRRSEALRQFIFARRCQDCSRPHGGEGRSPVS